MRYSSTSSGRRHEVTCWRRFRPVSITSGLRGAVLTGKIQSWDTATALGPYDYSVCTTRAKAKNIYYLLGVLRGRWDFPELLKLVQANVVRFGAGTVLVQDANRVRRCCRQFGQTVRST
jgi:phage terminase large subunit-like protein